MIKNKKHFQLKMLFIYLFFLFFTRSQMYSPISRGVIMSEVKTCHILIFSSEEGGKDSHSSYSSLIWLFVNSAFVDSPIYKRWDLKSANNFSIFSNNLSDISKISWIFPLKPVIWLPRVSASKSSGDYTFLSFSILLIFTIYSINVNNFTR